MNRLDGYQVALEFRNATLAFESGAGRAPSPMLRELNVPMVIVDESQGFASSMPGRCGRATSSDLAVVRFHGRNKAPVPESGR